MNDSLGIGPLGSHQTQTIDRVPRTLSLAGKFASFGPPAANSLHGFIRVWCETSEGDGALRILKGIWLDENIDEMLWMSMCSDVMEFLDLFLSTHAILSVLDAYIF